MVTRILPLDSDDVDDEEVLKVNQAYAQRLAHNKEREALHRFQELKKQGVVDSSDESDEEDEESSDDGFIPPDTELSILETLSKIKRKDPSIYSEDVKFFDDEENEDGGVENGGKMQRPPSDGSKPHKPVYLKDAVAKQLIEDGSDFDEDIAMKKRKVRDSIMTYDEEQEEIKIDFLRNVHVDEDDDDGGGGFLKLRNREKPQMVDDEVENDPYDKDIAARLEDYFGKDEKLDEDEKFLKEYLLNKSWIDADTDRIPSYEEIVGDALKDEEELERQDRFEAEYNFRFEEGAGSQVMGHSRIIENSVRRKDDSRRMKREKKKERLSEAAFERREELKRLKNIKKKEILEKLKKIQSVAGAKESEEILLEEKDLEEEFDPEEYDRKMREAFGDKYYAAEDAESEFQGGGFDDFQKPNFEEEDELLGLPKDWEEQAGSGFTAAYEKAKSIKLSDIEDENESQTSEDGGRLPDEEEDKTSELQGVSKRKKKGRISLREKLAFDKQLEEYYKLDYEDMIGDLPTRFKYCQVKPSMYGLSAAEILAADDKDLNQYVSLKKIAPYVTQEWKPKWRFQVSQKIRRKNALNRQLPPQVVNANEKPGLAAQLEIPEQHAPLTDDSTRSV
ncbi:hypothetical protein KP509_21G041100 [Ceratopteris richardii]|uniref:Kri1-like C-terminal domain-containing protein n=1 Tax=Ceratopteris richardii TaxID=49495 RepID=A0A8T2SCA2_CERRI|nr:hypothetical protein KP509_21G041100 [Ceratopteris richardii]